MKITAAVRNIRKTFQYNALQFNTISYNERTIKRQHLYDTLSTNTEHDKLHKGSIYYTPAVLDYTTCN